MKSGSQLKRYVKLVSGEHVRPNGVEGDIHQLADCWNMMSWNLFPLPNGARLDAADFRNARRGALRLTDCPQNRVTEIELESFSAGHRDAVLLSGHEA